MPATDPLTALLVVDMVASTRIRAAVGDAMFEQIRARVARDLTHVASEARGRLLLDTGDGAEFSFPSATAAIEAAVQLQRAVRRLESLWVTEPRIRLRMGITIGTGEGLAARAHAISDGWPADSIVLDDGVAEAAGSWLDATVVDAVERLDGRDVVRWHPTTLGEEVGLPLLVGDVRARFTGRREARAALRTLVTEPGDARVVVLEGDAGIGKSELAAIVGADAVEDGATLVWGRCTQPSNGAYQPLVEALEGFIDRAPIATAWLGDHVEDLARMSSRVYERLGRPSLAELDPETARLRALDAFVAWLDGLGTVGPVVVVVDDVQLATRTTMDALTHVLRAVPRGVTFVATRRLADEQGELDSWLGELGLLVDLHVMPLTGLDATDAAALVAAHASTELPANATAWVVEATQGNPFFLEQLARHLGSLTGGDAGNDDAVGAIPPGLRQTIHGRIAAAPPTAREVVLAASVLGEQFDIPLLLEIVDDDTVDEGLEAALAVGLVREVDARTLTYRFVHQLTQQVAYDTLSGLRRSRYHQRLHKALDDLPEPARGRRLQERAHHALAAAALVGVDVAVDAAVDAARRLRRTLAPADAAELLATTRERLGEDGALRLHVEEAAAWQDAGDARRIAASDRALELARAAEDGASFARAVLTRSRGVFSNALFVDVREVSLLEEALARPDVTDPAVRARLLAQLTMELAFDPDTDRLERVGAQAVAEGRRAADDRVLGRVLADGQWAHFHPVARRRAVDEELAQLAAATADAELAFWAAYHGAFTAVRLGEGARAGELLGAALVAAEQIARPAIRWTVLHTVWLDAWMRCDWAAATAAFTEQTELAGRMGNVDADRAASAMKAMLALETAPAPALVGMIEGVRARGGIPAFYLPVFACTLAELGDLPAAAALVRDAFEQGSVGPVTGQGHLFFATRLLEAAVIVGDDEVIAAMTALVEPRADEHGAIVFATSGSPRRVLGLAELRAGRRAAAVALLEQAVAADDRAGTPAWATRSRLALADAVADTDPERAAELRAQAASAARAHGLVRLLERAAAPA